MLLGLITVVPEGESQATRRLEHVLLHDIEVLVLAGEHAVDGRAPAVIDHAVGRAGQVFAEQLRQRVGAGQLPGVGPFEVIPQDVRGETIHELTQLCGSERREGRIIAAESEQLVM